MKSLLGKLGVILIGLAIFGCAEVWGADWKFLKSDDDCSVYYDAQNITRPYTNIVRVWVRIDWTEKGVLFWAKFGKINENLSHLINLWEIDCVEKKRRHLSRTDYDNKGGVIYSSSSPSKWDFIVPESRVEALSKEVCK